MLLDSARGSQIYSWAKREETTEDLSSVSVKSYLRGTKDPFYNRRFVRLLANTTLEDVMKVKLSEFFKTKPRKIIVLNKLKIYLLSIRFVCCIFVYVLLEGLFRY